MSQNYASVPQTDEENKGRAPMICLGGCACLLLISIPIISTMAVDKITDMAVNEFIKLSPLVEQGCAEKGEHSLDMENIAGRIHWPGCNGNEVLTGMKDFGTCTGWPKKGCITKSKIDDMTAFNKKHGPGKRVSYKSRPGTKPDGKALEVIKLTGWWLPAPGATADTPRIVVQHGFTSNSNKYRQMFMAYQLRKLGFSVLVNNLRDHCYSDNSTIHLVQWGQAYPQDLLGAWDAAVKGFEGAGKISKDKVGVLGFSMGAFTTNNAFGLEGDIPAAWVDGPPWTPQTGFNLGAKRTFAAKAGSLGTLLAPALLGPVWKNVEKYALERGVDLNANLPEKNIPMGPDTKRPVFVSANDGDTDVPYEDGKRAAALYKKLDKKYDLVEFWTHTGDCNGNSHCTDHVRHPEAYEQKLCEFWTSAFKMGDKTCGLMSVKERLLDVEAQKVPEALHV